MSLNLRRAMIFSAFLAVSAAPIVTAPRFFPSSASLRHRDIIIRERHGNEATSSNWSGYALTGAKGSFTEASGSWQVTPAMCGSTPNSYSATWVGIDGFGSNTVEQIGTESDCVGTQPSYYAWYEFYPHNYFTIETPINPGDKISADVKYSAGKYTVSLTDSANPNATFRVSTKLNQANRVSAECIVEAPYSGGVLPLADFVFDQFSCSAATGNGTLEAFGSFNAADLIDIRMTDDKGNTKAFVSSTISGSDFTDTWVSEGP